MSILVTGAAGFIGCNNVIALNRRGITDVIAVDNLEKGDKFKNLAQCQISDYFDKRDFIERVRAGTAPRPDAIFHPRHPETRKGVLSDEMLRGVAKNQRSEDSRIGQPFELLLNSRAGKRQPGELKHLSSQRKRKQKRFP